MDSKTVIDTPTLKKPHQTFTAEFKHQLIHQCQQPDTSVAKVAMQHHANLLHKWIRKSRSRAPVLKSPPCLQTDFLPIVLYSISVKEESLPPPAIKNTLAQIRIPLQQSQQMIKIDWPVKSAIELLSLLQGLIK